MQVKTLISCIAVMGVCRAAAQDMGAATKPNAACIEFNQAIVKKLDTGRLAEAELSLSAALLTSKEGDFEPSCLALTLHNMANVLALTGRLAEAELLAERSLRLDSLENSMRFRPLHLLWSVQFQRGERGKARLTFQKMQALRLHNPQDRSMFHGAAATQMQADGRYEEAEREYLKALAAAEEAGRLQTGDFAILLSGLGTLQLFQGQYSKAAMTLDRALSVANSPKDAVATDLIKILSVRGAIRARQANWQAAAEDFSCAVSIADRQAHIDPAELKLLLGNFGFVLGKAHRGKEAGSIKARAAAIPDVPLTNAMVDLSELSKKANPTRGKKADGEEWKK